MTAKRTFLWAAVVVLGAIVALVVYLSFADLGWLKPRIEAAVSEATGREFHIDGRLSVRALWTPAVELEGVRLANAAWGSRPDMLTVGRASARVKLTSLLSGPLRVEEVRVSDVDLLIEHGPDGASNLEFGTGNEEEEEPPESGEPEVPLIIDLAEIRNVKVVERPVDGKEQVLLVDRLDVTTDPERWLAIDGKGSVSELPLLIGGRVGDVAALERARDIGLDLHGSLGKLSFKTSGTIASLASMAGSELEARLAADDVAPILKRLAIDLPLTGALLAVLKIDTEDQATNVDFDAYAGDVSARGVARLEPRDDRWTFESNVAASDVAPLLKRMELDVPLKGALKADLKVVAQDGTTNVDFDASAGDVTAKGSAHKDSRDNIGFDFAVPALDRAGAAIGIAGLPQGDLAVDGEGKLEKNAIRLDPLTLKLGDAEVVASGTAGRGSGENEFEIQAKAASLAALRAGLPSQGLTAKGHVKTRKGGLAMEDFEAKIGDSDIAGEVALTMGKRPGIVGQLKSQRLDLTPFMGEPEQKEAKEQAAKSKEKKEKEKKEKRKYVFAREPLPFDLLSRANVDFTVQIGNLIARDIELKDMDTSIALKDGRLVYRSRSTAEAGGTSTSHLDLTTHGKSADLKARFYLRDYRINLFSGEDAQPAQIPPLGLTLDVTGRGDSPHALASTASGRLLVTQGAGRLDNRLIGLVSGDLIAQLFSALNPFAKHEPYSNWECTVFALDIKDGKADISGMLAQSEQVKIVGGGKIDLDSEKLNIEFNTKPRKGVGISADMFVTPFVKLTGTLASPSVGLNEKGALLAGGAAVATGGLSVLIKGALDRATGGADSCEKLLEKVGDHPPVDER